MLFEQMQRGKQEVRAVAPLLHFESARLVLKSAVFLFVFLSGCPSVCLSVCLFACLSLLLSREYIR